MTNNLSDEDKDKIFNEINRLRFSGYFKSSIPKTIKQTNIKDRYEIEVECPFCEKNITYKNYYFKLDKWFRDFMLCRECNKRFYILKPLEQK